MKTSSHHLFWNPSLLSAHEALDTSYPRSVGRSPNHTLTRKWKTSHEPAQRGAQVDRHASAPEDEGQPKRVDSTERKGSADARAIEGCLRFGPPGSLQRRGVRSVRRGAVVDQDRHGRRRRVDQPVHVRLFHDLQLLPVGETRFDPDKQPRGAAGDDAVSAQRNAHEIREGDGQGLSPRRPGRRRPDDDRRDPRSELRLGRRLCLRHLPRPLGSSTRASRPRRR